MIERYAKNIDIHSGNHMGGYDWLNPFTKGILLEQAYEVTFVCLYPSIILKLRDNSFLDHIDIPQEIYEKIQYFIDNRGTLKKNEINTYLELKKYVNSIFSKLGNEKSYRIIGLISQYMYQFYDELIQKNESNILYIDTDTIYFANKDYDMLDIDLVYDFDIVEMIVFEGRKKYAYVSNDEIKTKGYGKPKYQEEVIKIIKEGLRNRKINNLLKE
jgi:hypothetical protein